MTAPDWIALVVLLALAAPATAALAPVDDPAAGSATIDGQQAPPAADTERVCPVPEPAAETPATPQIVELYPNPPIPGNEGEYFVLEAPTEDASALTISDGHSTATIPADRPATRVAVTKFPNETATLTDEPVVELDGRLRLAATGDELTLSDDSGPIETVIYEDATEGEIWYRAGDGRTHPDGMHAIHRGEWWPQDATCLDPVTVPADDATAFVLPDSPQVVRETIEAAEDRIRLAGYTFTDEAVADALSDALDRGVSVDVLVDARPVGGTERATDRTLGRLDDAGATVHAIGGDAARFSFHHPKYAIVDDRVLVTTENWKPAGVGGGASRGWAVVVDSEALATELGAVFEADATGHDATPWAEFRARASFVEDDPATGSFPEHHPAASVDVDAVEVLLSPDNAEPRLAELLGEAEESIRIVQVRVDGPEFPLLQAAIDAAREGVEVSVLLDDSWYVADENRELATRLESIADREDLPIEVRRASGGERFDRIHAKGVVIDDDVTIIGSHNWNAHSLEQNREVTLVLHGEEPAAYYAAVFDGDWADRATWSVPIELVLVGLGGLALVLLVTHRFLEFARPGGRATPTSDRPQEERPRPIVVERSPGVGSPTARVDRSAHVPEIRRGSTNSRADEPEAPHTTTADDGDRNPRGE